MPIRPMWNARPDRRAAEVYRHLAYIGPPVTLAALLLDPPHGLLHQAYAPSDMRGGGTVNADGFDARKEPAPVIDSSKLSVRWA